MGKVGPSTLLNNRITLAFLQWLPGGLRPECPQPLPALHLASVTFPPACLSPSFPCVPVATSLTNPPIHVLVPCSALEEPQFIFF